MKNRFFDLPMDLQKLIYSYDITFYEIFDFVLPGFHSIQCYKGQSLFRKEAVIYFIEDLSRHCFIATNSLYQPTFTPWRIYHQNSGNMNLDSMTRFFKTKTEKFPINLSTMKTIQERFQIFD